MGVKRSVLSVLWVDINLAKTLVGVERRELSFDGEVR
jgi:hypothetical protein